MMWLHRDRLAERDDWETAVEYGDEDDVQSSMRIKEPVLFAAVVDAVVVVVCVYEDTTQPRFVRVAVFENGNHALVKCTKRMALFVVSSFVKKLAVAKDVPVLFPQFVLQDGLMARNYFDSHFPCNSNNTSYR